MATSVPNTSTFELLDVVDVVGGNDLQECYANSIDAGFDSYYRNHNPNGDVMPDKSSLYNFRNYQIPGGILYRTVAMSDYLVFLTRYYYTQTVEGTTSTSAIANRQIVWNSLTQNQVTGSVRELNNMKVSAWNTSYGAYLYGCNRIYMKFDFTSIPLGSIILNAQMQYRIENNYGAKYSEANNWGPIHVTTSASWGRLAASNYSSRVRGQRIFTGTKTLISVGSYKYVHMEMLPSQFYHIEGQFGTYFHAALLCDEDENSILPPTNGEVGLQVNRANYRPWINIEYITP